MGRTPFPEKLWFIVNRCSAGRYQTQYWLAIPEFQNEMFTEIRNGSVIDDRCILNAMQRVYEGLSSDPNFDKRRASRAIRILERSLSKEVN